MSNPARSGSTLLSRMRTCDLFAELTDAELVSLEPHCRLISLKRGDHLWRCGAEARHIHYIISGLVEVRRPTPATEMTLMAFFGPKECPGMPVVLESRRYGADALISSSQARLLTIEAAVMLELMQRDARAANAMTRLLLSQVRLLHGKIDVMAAGTVARRLAVFFLNLAGRFGDELDGGEVVIPITLTRTQVATYIDARVETVIRTLSAWKKGGTLTLLRDRIELHDVKALEREIAS